MHVVRSALLLVQYKERSRLDNHPKILRKPWSTPNLTTRTILLVNQAKTILQ
jgi:hypothetical protein